MNASFSGRLAPALLLLLFLASVRGDTGLVLDPSATPLGYSLTAMATQLGQFGASGNDLQFYPQTPFQILFAAKFSLHQTTCPGGGAGVVLKTTNTFVVPEGTPLFVPLGAIDNATPYFGIFPANSAGAIDYFFGAANYGGQRFQIIVDEAATSIGPAYLAGPVSFQTPLINGATSVIQLGAFITPLSKGHHVVSIGGGYIGPAVIATVPPYQCYFQSFDYVVNVVEKD
jgi:hypothetical protein